MTKKDPVYYLKNLRHFYGNTKVLDIDELRIETGSITGLTGPNGSGKSTLLKLLAFAQKPFTGHIFYKGRIEHPFSPGVRSRVTLLTQKPYLLKRSVFENIVYGLKIRKDKDRLEDRVKEALLSVGLDYQVFARRKWHELSGGEAQRVAMAARLILKPEVLLLDEPIASVDTESAKLIRHAALNARNNWGATLVIASHDLQWLYSICDRQFSIFKGTLFTTGMENIIIGPFVKSYEKTGKQTLVKKLKNGQHIFLDAPSKNLCTAIIPKKNIRIVQKKDMSQSHTNHLSGHIISMLLENKKEQVMVTISICDISLVITLCPDQISRLDLYPGKKVIVQFNPSDVEWI